MTLRWLFVDMNSYFASVEQQDRPELRGKPVAVAPVGSDTTCAIAASYEAKRFGIKTGTNIGEAKELCADLKVVLANPKRYVEVHHLIKEAVESVLPIDGIYSIDEMGCRLIGKERQLENAIELGRCAKQMILDRVGVALKCSVGIAPSRIIAKVAADMKKPD